MHNKTFIKGERIHEIDMLRGLAMFSMIIIHATAYFLSNSFAHWLWDLSQFAVPLFIFCSAYLFFLKPFVFDLHEFIEYFKKRIIRLLIPYYIFGSIFLLIIYKYSHNDFSKDFIRRSVLIWGGIDFNWLVLLFLYFIFLLPLISWLYQNKRKLFYLYSCISFIVSLYLVFYQMPLDYRLIMWLPWSLLVVFTLLFMKHKDSKVSLSLFLFGSLAVFTGLRFIELKIGHTLWQYNNKYPPNLYHLSFGIFWTCFLYMLAKKKVFSIPVIKNLFHFLSVNSYSIYFVHFMVIYFLTLVIKMKFEAWYQFFLWILILTLGVQYIINKFSNILRHPELVSGSHV